MKDNVCILECTLRDGSYLIDYQFTAEDTYIICTGLAQAGFKLIEVGHGVGLRSSKAGKGKAALTDEEYLEAARAALSGTDAMFGMFFIPGIAKMEDLEMASGYGMGFVRVGTNITEIDQAKPYIERAKSLGMLVSSNLMKSYAVPSIGEFLKLAKKADEFGADIISVVDSAGGMLIDEVRDHVLRLRDITDKKIGFHGHNNLQLAVANTLEAIRCGANVVDSTLQGMGRSAGNTQTEILVMLLEKLGYHTGIDVYMAMDLGERVVKPMMNRGQGVDDTSIVSGIAQFHSSFSAIVDDAAQKYKIDPRMLIMEVSNVDRINVSPELAEETARSIKKKLSHKPGDVRPTIFTAIIEKKRRGSSMEQAKTVLDEMISQSRKTGKESVFSLTLSQNNTTVFPFIRESASMIIGNCEAQHLNELKSIISVIDGHVDWILIDESCSRLQQYAFENHVRKSLFAWYSEARALCLGLSTLISQRRPLGKVLLFCGSEDSMLVQLSLKQHGIEAISSSEVFSDNANTDNLKKLFKDIGAVVSFDKDFAKDLHPEYVDFLGRETQIYAARPHAFTESFWEASMARALPMFRVDSRCGFAAELSLVIETKKLVDSIGISSIAGIPVVSGGIIAKMGIVVVDSIHRPSKVIGIADGFGGILRDEETQFEDTMETVKTEIIAKRLRKEF